MMKPVLHIVFTIAILHSKAQHIGIGTETPNNSAVLEISSVNSGFLLPRMSYAQRNAIQNPATGLMVFCTNCDSSGQPQFYNGNRWCNMLGQQAALPVVTNLPSVTIGTQIWSSKNLDVSKYRNGDPIPQVTDATQWGSLNTGAWCWYNNDSAIYAANYGKLYNWYAVNDPRGLAPLGWHVPTDAEWNIMEKFLDPSVDTTCRCGTGNAIGPILKNTTGWNGGGNGNNSSGFSANPGGGRFSGGSFLNSGSNGYWWNASAYDNTLVWLRLIYYYGTVIQRNYTNKVNGFSVRVVRD